MARRRLLKDMRHPLPFTDGVVCDSDLTAMLQVDQRQFEVQFIQRNQMRFVQIVNRCGRGEIERAEIHFRRAVFGFQQQRQTLRAAYQRTRGVNCAAIFDQHRTGDRFAVSFEFEYITSLLFERGADLLR